MKKTALRDEFFATTHRVIKEELPGIRGDLQRRIAKDIASQLSLRVYGVFQESRELRTELASAQRRIRSAGASTQSLRDIERVIETLRTIQERENG